MTADGGTDRTIVSLIDPLPLHILGSLERCYANSILNRPPVIGFFLIIQVPDASDMRGMALAFRPVDRFVLGFERHPKSFLRARPSRRYLAHRSADQPPRLV
jgi:hypothetical protein